MTNKEKGNAAEEKAAAFYISKGFAIAARNFRFRRSGEIDIIASRCENGSKLLVFCEVKYRSDPDFASPSLAVDVKKIRKIKTVAEGFLLNNSSFRDYEFRFDVVEVTGEENALAVTVLENAF